MSKQKNYYKLFVDYCIKNSIWFAVCGDGTIDEVTFCDYFTGDEIVPDKNLSLGTKAAYDWLVAAYKEAAGESEE